MNSHRTLKFGASKNTAIYMDFSKAQAVKNMDFRIYQAFKIETSTSKMYDRKSQILQPFSFPD